MKIFLFGLLTVTALVLVGVWLKYGTLEPCGALKVKLRQDAQHEGGIAGALESIMPDSAVDKLITVRYGTQTPGVCLKALLNPDQKRAD